MKLLLIIPFLFCGCAGYGTIAKNLAKDGAIVRADINSPWGKQTFLRIGTTTNQMRVTADGEIVINEPKPATATATTKK